MYIICNVAVSSCSCQDARPRLSVAWKALDEAWNQHQEVPPDSGQDVGKKALLSCPIFHKF